MARRTRRNGKFNARKVKADGYTFDSQVEYYHYLHLRTLAENGEITDLRVHQPFVIIDAFKHGKKRVAATKYEADFVYVDAETGRRVVDEVKGGKATQTAVFNLKWKLFLQRYGRDYDARIIEY